MRDEMTQDEIYRYRRDGFVIVDDLLDADELTQWREVVEHAVTERRGRSFAAPTVIERDTDRMSEEDRRYYGNVFTQQVNLWQTDEDMRALMFDARLGKLMADLAGVEGIRIWHDQALIKQPYGNPTAFHLDVPYWSFSSADALSVWVALDDATIENGCLHYVPGSHQAQKFDNVAIGREIGALFDVYPEWKDVAPVPCPVPAGSACVHNGLTFHGAGANMTPGRRRAMTCAYMPDGSTFNGQPNILPPAYLSTLQIGDTLADDQHNPLIFSRSGKRTTAGVGAR